MKEGNKERKNAMEEERRKARMKSSKKARKQ